MIRYSKYFLCIVVLVGLLTALPGCMHNSTTGRDFNPWLGMRLVPGKTSTADAVKFVGQPDRIDDVAINGEPHRIFRYTYKNKESVPLVGLVSSIRKKYLYADFAGDTLRGYLFGSNDPNDSVNFDHNDATRIVAGWSRTGEVIRWLGTPHGRMLIPSAMAAQKPEGAEKAVEKWSYRGSVVSEEFSEPVEKMLDLYLDSAGCVVKKNLVVPPVDPPADLDTAFLNFSDAAPCGDQGGYDSVRVGDGLMMFPFLIQRNVDGEVTADRYPATQDFINRYIHYALASSFNLVPVDSAMPHFIRINKYALDLLHQLNSAKETPLSWGGPIEYGTIPPRTWLYFPFVIERETRYRMTARLYVLIADPLGNIFFARTLSFDPAKWSADIFAFKKDINGRLPLAE